MHILECPDPVVTIEWLQNNHDAENLVILDASVPPIVEFTATRLPLEVATQAIPGALRFDYDTQVCDRQSSYPHMMPGPEEFARQTRSLGINNDSVIVIYDVTGVYASPRAWWMFRAMGHKNVAVLNGGLPAWHLAGLPLQGSYEESGSEGNFTASEDPERFCNAMTLFQILNDRSCMVLDARSPGRFAGRDPEPRENLRGGHMPNARNLPFQEVLDDIYLRPVDQLVELFSGFADTETKLAFTCGSGLSACILTLAANVAGYENLTVYDASWCEWGLPSKLPVVTGA